MSKQMAQQGGESMEYTRQGKELCQNLNYHVVQM